MTGLETDKDNCRSIDPRRDAHLKTLITPPPQLRHTTVLVIWMLGSVLLLPSAADALFATAFMYLWWTQRHSLLAIDTLRDPLFLYATALTLLIGLSGAWSTGASAADHVQVWWRIVCTLGFLTVVAHAQAHESGFATYLRHVLIMTVLASGVICIALFWLNPPPADGRLTGLFRLNNPGRAAHLYAVLLPALLASVWLGQGRWRQLAIAATLAALVCIALSGTRAAWLGGALGISSLLIASVSTSNRHYLLWCSLSALVIAALFSLAVLYPDSVFSALLLPRGDSYRIAIWNIHLQGIMEGAWLWGSGALTPQPFLQIMDRSERGAHNLFLSVTEQVGVIGVTLLVMLLIGSAARLLANLKVVMARVAISMLLAGIVISLFNYDRVIDKVSFVWFVIWLPVGVALAFNTNKGSPAELR